MTDDRRMTPDPGGRRREDDSWMSIASAVVIWGDRGSRRSARLRAREHWSGLRMVYGESDRGTAGAGEIVAADQDLEAAIRRVGDQISAPAQLAADCIASMKP